MSNLNPVQFGGYYHASGTDFHPGDRLVPPAKRRHPINYDHPQGETWRNRRVFMTKDPRNAAGWAEGYTDPKVYEVHPLGVKKHAATDYDFTGAPWEVDDEEDQYQAKGAVVVRRLDSSEYKR